MPHHRRLYLLVIFLALSVSRSCYAQAASPPGPIGDLSNFFLLIAVCYGIFYFLVLKPEQTKAREQKALLDNLKRGETVLTSSGIFGRVSGIEKDYILLEIAANVKVKIDKSHILSKEEIKKEESSKQS